MNSFLKERLEKLRDRLLDITNRNRMINSNFSARSKQFFRFIDEIPNQLFTQLQSGTMSFKAIPEENVEIRDEDTDEFKNEYNRQLISNEDYLNEIYELESYKKLRTLVIDEQYTNIDTFRKVYNKVIYYYTMSNHLYNNNHNVQHEDYIIKHVLLN